MKIIEEFDVLRYVSAWATEKSQLVLKEYMQVRGLTKETIAKYRIGWDPDKGRIVIPIENAQGETINFKKYRLPSQRKEGEPKILNEKGCTALSLFPIQSLLKTKKEIIVCAGEHDALLLNQLGYSAVTNVAGEGCWAKEWNDMFAGKIVYVVYDCDKAGREGAQKVVKNLSETALEVKNIDLGLKQGEDVSDWFLKYRYSQKDFSALLEETESHDNYAEITLVNATDSQYCGEKIKFRCVVAGKDLSPFQVPLKVKVWCSFRREQSEKCMACPLYDRENYEVTFSFDQHKEYLIQMINRTDMLVLGAIRRCLGLPSAQKCRSARVEIVQRQNVEQLAIIPDINYERADNVYTLKRGLYFGAGIQANQNYLMKGSTLPDPDTQMGIITIKKADSVRDIFSQFKMTEETLNRLKIFQPENQDDEDSVEEKVLDICRDLSMNVTKVYGREDLIMGLSLIYHSVIQFRFQGDILKKGWVEGTVLGDTGTGKTKTIERLVNHFQAGEFSTSGENATLPGILGAIQPVGNKQYSVVWGRIPLNHRGFYGIDEVDTMAKEILTRLTGVRSSGVAELIKVQTQRTMAQTRLLFVCNPPGGEMSNYTYGIEVLPEIFPTAQDIRRIDFCVGCSKDQVSLDVINAQNHDAYEHRYTSELCHLNVMRAWNIEPDQVVFEPDTESLLLQVAKNLSQDYSAEIPLLLGSDTKDKLARLAVSLATWLFSTESGWEVIVRPVHVHIIMKFLRTLYNTPTLGFRDFSKLRLNLLSLNGNSEKLEQLFGKEEAVQQMLGMNQLKQSDFQEIFHLPYDTVAGTIGDLRDMGAIIRTPNYYKKTPALQSFLRHRLKYFISQKETGGFFK